LIENKSSDIIILRYSVQSCKGQTIVFKKQEKRELLYEHPIILDETVKMCV